MQPESLRVVDLGIVWPPETFIARRLQALAERGVDVVVSTPTANDSATSA